MDWVFASNPDRSSEGDVGSEEFRGIDIMVREATQNSIDAAAGSTPVRVHYTIGKLTGGLREAFLKEISFTTLKSHIDSWANDESLGPAEGLQARRAMRAIYDGAPIFYVCIRDYETKGLELEEFAKEGSYFRLVRSKGISTDPSSSSRGGSWGYGSSVFRNFSSLRVVVFNSTSSDYSNRQLGVCRIGSHDLTDQPFSGKGFLGLKNAGTATSTTCSKEVSPVLWDLFGRRSGESGLSVFIPFLNLDALALENNETDSHDWSLKSIAGKVHSSFWRHHWPAVVRGKVQQIEIELSDDLKIEPLDLEPPADLLPFQKAYTHYLDPNSPAPVGYRYFTFTGPKLVNPIIKQSSSSAELPTTEADVLIADCADDEKGFVKFRGVGQIVPEKDGLKAGKARVPGNPEKDFVVCLVCGEARKSPTDADVTFDKFLRASETKTHDSWTAGQDSKLSTIYERGAGNRLNGFLREVKREISDHFFPIDQDAGESTHIFGDIFSFGRNPGIPSLPPPQGQTKLSIRGQVSLIPMNETHLRFEFVVGAPQDREEGWSFELKSKLVGIGRGGAQTIQLVKIELPVSASKRVPDSKGWISFDCLSEQKKERVRGTLELPPDWGIDTYSCAVNFQVRSLT